MAVLCPTALLVSAAPRPAVDYILSPEVGPAGLTALSVTVRFAADRSGMTVFAWPESWAGDRELWSWARDLTVEGATAVEHPSGGEWRLRAKPGAVLRVRYRIVSAYDHDPTAAETRQSLPVIRPGWAFAPGEALFGAPRGRGDAPAAFRWDDLGSKLPFASNLQSLSSPAGSSLRVGRLEDVRESVITLGRAVRVYSDGPGASGVRVALAGEGYAFPDSELVALARRIVVAERRFWGDDIRAPFLVAASPLASTAAGGGFSGTGRRDGFALWLDRNATADRLRWLLAHENFHNWNPVQLGGAGGAHGAGEAAWFVEGFTDYYARALALRSGVVEPEGFARQWNEVLRNYAASPVRTAPNTRIAADFWNDDAVQALPYQRGALLAVLWNRRLRTRSGGRLGLDDVLRIQRAQARSRANPHEGAAELFVRIVGRLDPDLRGDVARYVTRGDAVALPPDAFGPCARVETRTGPTFDRGFDAEATIRAGMVAQGVQSGSAAYAAGLRDGMRIVARETGPAGDPDTPYVLTVEDGGAKRVLRFLPRGAATLTRQEVVILPGHDRTDCARGLSGER